MKNTDDLYMDIAFRVAKQSHGIRAQVGALIVKDNNILSFGYNGTPTGFDNKCEHVHYDTTPGFNGSKLRLETKKEVLHAESNAVLKIAKSTYSSNGATLYVTLSPCFECAKMIIQSGITRVVYGEKYRDESSITFLQQNNIKVEQHERTIPLGREISPTIDPTMYSPGEPEDYFYNPEKQG